MVKDSYGKTLYTKTVNINKPGPVITTQPASKSAAVGTSVTLTVKATGSDLTYQWQYKEKSSSTWSNASGKTASWTLTVAAVHYGFDFRCRVTDIDGNSTFTNTVQINKP